MVTGFARGRRKTYGVLGLSLKDCSGSPASLQCHNDARALRAHGQRINVGRSGLPDAGDENRV